jgi:hypothetical protein
VYQQINERLLKTNYVTNNTMDNSWIHGVYSAINQDNVSEWEDMSIRGLLFQWASTIKIQLSMLV